MLFHAISAVILVIFTVSHQGYAKEVICDKNAAVCTYGCYNSEVQQCVEGKVCKLTEKYCEGACFDPNVSDCVATSSQEYVCPRGQQVCENDSGCYDPETHYCTEEGKYCPIGEKYCDWQCYNPETHHCAEDAHVCTKEEILCGPTCYTPSEDTICTNENICNVGEEGCGWKCFNPVTDDLKCHNGTVLCEKDEELCGYSCYDSSTGVCLEDSQVCDFEQEPCGLISCYFPNNETCYRNRTRYGDTPCPNTQKLCGYDCYDDGTVLCLEGTDNTEHLCSLDEDICGYDCYVKESGKKCINGRLCNEDEELCGHRCYEPSVLPKLTCHNNTALCQEGEEPCGSKCFDSSTHKCAEVDDLWTFDDETDEIGLFD